MPPLAQDSCPPSPGGSAGSPAAQLANLTTQLTRAHEQLVAYQQEAALPAPEHP